MVARQEAEGIVGLRDHRGGHEVRFFRCEEMLDERRIRRVEAGGEGVWKVVEVGGQGGGSAEHEDGDDEEKEDKGTKHLRGSVVKAQQMRACVAEGKANKWPKG